MGSHIFILQWAPHIIQLALQTTLTAPAQCCHIKCLNAVGKPHRDAAPSAGQLFLGFLRELLTCDGSGSPSKGTCRLEGGAGGALSPLPFGNLSFLEAGSVKRRDDSRKRMTP